MSFANELLIKNKMISIYVLIAVILLFVLVILGFMRTMSRIEDAVVWNEAVVKGIQTALLNFKSEVGKVAYNSRKRDENILRRITKQANYLLQTQAMILTTGGKIDGVAKQCRGIDGVARQCVNNDLEMRSGITKANWSLKECERILDLFEAVTERAKRGMK